MMPLDSFNLPDIPELTDAPKLSVSYNVNETEAQFECEFDRLPRGDVVYRVQFFVEDVEVKTWNNVDGKAENYVLSESEYGQAGYGIKVSFVRCRF